MKKYLCVVLTIIILMTSVVSAITLSEAKQELEQYLSNSKHDFFGWRGEKLYFDLREQYAKGRISKEIEFDAKMLKYQARITFRNFEENKEAYGMLMIAGMGLHSITNPDAYNFKQQAADQVKIEKWQRWISKNTRK